MKSIINILIFMLMTAASLGQRINVSIPDNIQGDIGDTILVPVSVDKDISTDKIYSLQFVIDYTESIILCDSVEREGSICKSAQVYYNNVNGAMRINAVSGTPLSGSGTLLKLRIVLLNPGYANLVFKSDTTLNYFNEGHPLISLKNGRIRVLKPPTIRLSPSDAILNVGETQKYSVSGGTAPYEFSVSDEDMADIDKSTGILSAKARGVVDVIAKDKNGYIGSEKVDIRSFSIHIRDTSYYQRNIVEIPISFKNHDGSDVYSGEFTIKFNEAILEVLDFVLDESTLSDKASIIYKLSPGRVAFSFAAKAAITGSYEIGRIRARIADRTSGITIFSMEEGIINEHLLVKTFLGRFTINRLPTLSLSPTKAELMVGETKQFTVTGGHAPYQWSVKHPEIASIKDGLLTALSGGTTTIQAVDELTAVVMSENIEVFDTWVGVRDSSADIFNYHMMLPIDVGFIPNKLKVQASSGNVTYTSTAIDHIELVTSNTLSENWLSASHSDGNVTKISVANADPMDNNGGIMVYMHIFFNRNLKPKSSILFNLDEFYLNEGTPRIVTRRGTLKVGTVTDIKKVNRNSHAFRVYPNPVRSSLFIKSNQANLNILSFKIMDLSGKTVDHGMPDKKTGELQIDIQHLSSGMYLLQMSDVDNTYSARFIKE